MKSPLFRALNKVQVYLVWNPRDLEDGNITNKLIKENNYVSSETIQEEN